MSDPNRWALAHKMRAQNGLPPMTDEECDAYAAEIDATIQHMISQEDGEPDAR